MAIQSPEELFSILEKSNLLDAEQILAARQSIEGLGDAAQAARKLARDGLLTRWQAAQLLAGRSSFLLGKYRLVDLLGRGGMGRVFLGRHVTMQRPAALKIVSREVGNNPAALERFLAEARAIAALDHPAIVQAYSVDSEGDRYYIVMEYVDGRDLQRVVEEDGPLDCQTAIEYIRQAADGLAHAHSRNLVHCDIKPSNLLVNSQGQVKILDMGMARLGGRDDPDNAATGAGPILGSVDYLPPEQALNSDDFDHRADIYSLGCTLYFLLTGHPPFPDGTLAERILKHQTQQPRPLPTERPDVPPQLAQVCRRMMAKQPEDRFQSADEIVTALTKVAALASESAEGDGMSGARPALATRASTAVGGENASADAEGLPAAPLMPVQQWLATTAGRLLLGGAALFTLLVLVGISIAIVVAMTPAVNQPPLDGEVAMDPPQTSPEDKPEKEEPEERDEFDLAHAFGSRSESGEGDSESGQPENGQTTDSATPPEPAGQPNEPAAEPSTAEKPPPGEAVPEKPKETQPAKPPPEKPGPGKPDPTPPAKPPATPKPQNPLREVGKTIALAEGVEPGGVLPIGKVYLQKAGALEVDLLGGETALKGERQYVVEPDSAEGSVPQWLIRLRSELPGGKKSTADLARIALANKDQVLQIEWLAQASVENVQALRNCAVALRVGKDTAWVGFGEPAPAEPLVLDFAKRSWRTTLTSDALPETDSLRVEVTKIEGNVPKLAFKPAKVVKEGEKMEIELAKPDAALVKLQFSFTVRGRKVSVEAVPMFVLAGIGQWPLSLRDAQRVGTQVLAQRNRYEVMLKAMPERDPNKAKVAEEKAKFDLALTQLAGLGNLYNELNEQARIHYRLFAVAGERQVDLWTTEMPGAEASSAGSRPLTPNHRFGSSGSVRPTQLVGKGP